jgi:hypothetical protein
MATRENIAQSREALRIVLAEGRLVLRPDVTNARFEGSLVLSHEEFFGETHRMSASFAWI